MILIKPLPPSKDIVLAMQERFRGELERLRKKPKWDKEDRGSFQHLKGAIVTIKGLTNKEK